MEVVSVITTTEVSFAKKSTIEVSIEFGSLTPTSTNFFFDEFQIAAKSLAFVISTVGVTFAIAEVVTLTESSFTVSYKGSSNGAFI